MNNYTSLAKSAVENYIEHGKIIAPFQDLPKEFSEKAGVFVTIKKEGQLRGCIGTYLPTKENIAEEIIHNAIAAAIEDYRFTPIQKEELPNLSYVVYILNEPEFVKDTKKLNPKKYGIIVKTEDSKRAGLLLPDLENIDTIEQQISIACQKGEIDLKKENILIYRFTVKKYE
ncbi:AmmeMemoRadiSam system protein A [Patescibacteria group bacterium]|nr:AmmeMemoRadiSam system protein A [Patescibacteria group bacterium]MBU4368072.1 AmmeMemoRadiSam system protein A [Patescibacteria group bacterium]MBU4462301.1 AmmeMemoRadiSam system protein A [Patescibacteria group bacterium]MCG2700350.1 AmmeMemoRadiSam system protein A [Candidatus Parcubacteria bacterium]